MPMIASTVAPPAAVLLASLVFWDLRKATAADVDIVAFGADPTGQRDSTAAIQAAVHNATGGRVLIPPGLFVLESAVQLVGQQTISGAPGATLLQRGSIGLEVPPNTTCSHLTLQGIRLEYNATKSATDSQDVAIVLRGLQHSVISDLTLRNYGGQVGIAVRPEFTAPTAEGNGNFIFNRIEGVDIDVARIGVEYTGLCNTTDPRTLFVDKGAGYLHDGTYHNVPVVPCTNSCSTATATVPGSLGSVGVEFADITVGHGAVTRFEWTSAGTTLSYGECVTSPAASLGELGPGGHSYCARVFQRPLSVISNNVWRGVTIRSAREFGVLAVQWADTERWYDLYVMLSAPNATAVSLGSPSVFTKIDRFMLHSPCIVYAPNLAAAAVGTLRGVVLNRGVYRINLQDVHSDKTWAGGLATLVQDLSGPEGSYVMTLMALGHGETAALAPGVALGPAQFAKGGGSEARGRVIVPAGRTEVNVTTLALARAPVPGEVMLTPACNLAAGASQPRALWLVGLHSTGFVVGVSAAASADCPVDYQVSLGSL